MTKILKSFDLDFSDLPATATSRRVVITGDNEAEFYLEITNAAGNYYNFTTGSYQAAKTSLDAKIVGKKHFATINFPATTSATQYNINFWAKVGTEHADYVEVRFADNSIDINSSTGSNSLLIKKIIYQYTDLTLTLSPYSPNSIGNIIKASSKVDSTITVPRFGYAGAQAFTLSCEVDNGAQSYQIIKQPTENDILTFNQLTVGSAPEVLPGENEYPAVNNTDTVNGAITGAAEEGSIKVVMDTRVAETMIVGDKITASTTTDTVDGAISGAAKIVMDNNVAGKMAHGDRIRLSIDPAAANHKYFEANVVVVNRLDPDGDNAKEFSMTLGVIGGPAASATVSDGATLSFSPLCNESLTTVAALDPDGDNESEFSMSQHVGLIDGATLSFSNRKNYQWPLDNIQDVTENMQVFTGDNVTASTITAKYEDTVTLNEGTREESVIIKNSAPFKTTKNQTPTITNGVLTTQEGNIVFNNQQALALAGDTVNIGGYGTGKILETKGYDLKFTDLKVELDTITTTTTAAVVNSTTIPVASVNGILPGVSTVSGIGINASVADPTVNSRSVTSGAGELTLSAAQNLESGVTLTFANAGQKATITGNVEILQSGYKTPNIRFDVEKLLSIT